jgi:hypothetical protein
MKRFWIWVALGAGIGACGPQRESGPSRLVADIDGRVQKGPFVAGSTVDVEKLDTELRQTGDLVSTTVVDETGEFGIDDIELQHSVVRVAADGYYFRELEGRTSEGRLELVSYADVANATTLNVNALGHLEAARIEHLVREEGLPFARAKAQAHEEVLAVFAFTSDGVDDAERLDIFGRGAGNAKLLALSILLQGTRTVAELAELLSNITTDIRGDGILDGKASGSALMNAARTVNLVRVRENLEQRLDELGLASTVADFESQIGHFIENAPYDFTGGIDYASDGTRPNVLDKEMRAYQSGQSDIGLGFRAVLPPSTQLTIRITQTGSNDMPWAYAGGQGLDWAVTLWDGTGVQEFTALRDGAVDLQLFLFHGTGSATLDYFEYGSETPTFSKDVTWAP